MTLSYPLKNTVWQFCQMLLRLSSWAQTSTMIEWALCHVWKINQGNAIIVFGDMYRIDIQTNTRRFQSIFRVRILVGSYI